MTEAAPGAGGRQGGGERRRVPVDPAPPHRLVQCAADDGVHLTDGRRRQALLAGEVQVELVEVPGRQLADLEPTDGGDEVQLGLAPVRLHLGRRAVAVDHVEPLDEQLGDGHVPASSRPTLVDLGLDLGEDLLGVSLGAPDRPGHLVVPAGGWIPPGGDAHLPPIGPPLSDRPPGHDSTP